MCFLFKGSLSSFVVWDERIRNGSCRDRQSNDGSHAVSVSLQLALGHFEDVVDKGRMRVLFVEGSSLCQIEHPLVDGSVVTSYRMSCQSK